MEKLKKGKSWCWLLGALFIFVLFYYMTVRTPLAGDDWGYAVNGMSGNPFVKAWEFYFTWSGRYFAELWGFIVAPRKVTQVDERLSGERTPHLAPDGQPAQPRSENTDGCII